MYRLFSTLFLIFFVFLSSPVIADEHILTPMFGYSKWSDPAGHTARGSAISFRDKRQTTIGFRYLYLLDNNFAVGGNIYTHELDIATTGQADEAAVAHIHALIEYFFTRMGNASLFAGAGYGVSVIGFTGGNLNEKATAGRSIELNGGVLYRITDIIGVQLEYKYSFFDMEEDIDSLSSNIDSSSNSLLLGLTIHL